MNVCKINTDYLVHTDAVKKLIQNISYDASYVI